jgi:hypothetical protein
MSLNAQQKAELAQAAFIVALHHMAKTQADKAARASDYDQTSHWQAIANALGMAARLELQTSQIVANRPS